MSYTNIKVCCRFRPRNELELREEKSHGDIVRYDNNSVLINREGENRFNFDHVFKETSTQEEVFNTAALPVIEDMLRGYNCTIFVYGQTSSGKTYTVSGSPMNKGLAPRLVEKIFDHIYDSDEGVEFTVCVSYVEIYLEKIRDLLAPEHDNLKLREGGYREGVWIQGVTEEYASCYEDILNLMKKGNKNRSVGETKMNQKSSRSHSVFILTLVQHNLFNNSKITSKLVLVDLAGSEKVGKTGATGLLLRQAQHTNKSLTYLGMVIRALTENASYIPYRDSKLTRILTDSLGGNSKTCLIVTCSPSVYNITETLSTLRFGTRVKSIKNKPRPNVEKSVDEYKRLLEDAYKRIEELEQRQETLFSPRKDGLQPFFESVPTELIQEFEQKIDEQKAEVKQIEKKLAQKEQELQEITDNFQERIAQKESEIELLTEEYNMQIAEKEQEIKKKVMEIDKLRGELLAKSNEVLAHTDNNSSKQYYQRMMNSRQEMVSVLEVALRSAEEMIRSQRYDYDTTIRTLKEQIDELRDTLYRPAINRTSKGIVVPVRKKKRK